jgi:hypothetical protein
MRKVQVLGIALVAMLAFSAVLATAAFAGEWLVEGKAITSAEGALNSETEGELKLISYAEKGSASVLAEITCSGIFDGTVGPGSTDTVTTLLNLSKEEINKTALTELALLCNVTLDAGALTDCKVGTENALLWAINLPWSTEIELMSNGEELDVFLDNAGKMPGYYVECESLLGISGTNTCEGGVNIATLTNGTGTPTEVLGSFTKLAAMSERANCTLTGTETGEVINPTAGKTWAIGVELEHLATAVS